MYIEAYRTHPSYRSLPHDPAMIGNTDRLVFRAIDRNGNWLPRTVTHKLTGDLTIEDKLIKFAAKGDKLNQFNLPELPRGAKWMGPFIDSDCPVRVKLPPWDDAQDFNEVLAYLANTRKPMTAYVETIESVIEVKGRATDEDEFKHLYLTRAMIPTLINIKRG